MAAATSIKTTDNGTDTYTISSTGEVNLGPASASRVSHTALQFIKGAATISVTISKKVHRSSVADASAIAAYYLPANSSTPTTTALTADTFVLVPCTGADVILNVGTLTGGTLKVEVRRLVG